MKISQVSIVPIRPNKSLFAFGSCLIEDSISLQSIGIHSAKEGGIRLTFPARKLAEGTYKFYYKIINENLQSQIKKEFEKEIENLGLWDFKILDEKEEEEK